MKRDSVKIGTQRGLVTDEVTGLLLKARRQVANEAGGAIDALVGKVIETAESGPRVVMRQFTDADSHPAGGVVEIYTGNPAPEMPGMLLGTFDDETGPYSSVAIAAPMDETSIGSRVEVTSIGDVNVQCAQMYVQGDLNIDGDLVGPEKTARIHMLTLVSADGNHTCDLIVTNGGNLDKRIDGGSWSAV